MPIFTSFVDEYNYLKIDPIISIYVNLAFLDFWLLI